MSYSIFGFYAKFEADFMYNSLYQNSTVCKVETSDYQHLYVCRNMLLYAKCLFYGHEEKLIMHVNCQIYNPTSFVELPTSSRNKTTNFDNEFQRIAESRMRSREHSSFELSMPVTEHMRILFIPIPKILGICSPIQVRSDFIR